MCGRFWNERGGGIRVSENMAAINRCPQWKTECAFFVFEKDGHLKQRLFDILSSVDSRIGGPHCLRDYCTPIHDAAVEYPAAGRAQKPMGNMGRDGIDEEEIAVAPGVRRGCMRGNEGGLQ
jgi:hypothetical protein